MAGFIIFWFLLACVVGAVAEELRRDRVRWGALSVILSPPIGLLALLVVEKLVARKTDRAKRESDPGAVDARGSGI